jgi:peptidoglycan hydrolase CwlO-like protein
VTGGQVTKDQDFNKEKKRFEETEKQIEKINKDITKFNQTVISKLTVVFLKRFSCLTLVQYVNQLTLFDIN